MRVLIANNYVRQPGGEDESTAKEIGLLRAYGHEVRVYRRHNSELNDLTWARSVSAAGAAVWSRRSAREIAAIVRDFQPDVGYFQNIFPLISPSAYEPLNAAGVPVVQALRSYRLICPNTLLFRRGAVCTDCVGRVPWPAVWHACYRRSRPASAVAAAMIALHRWRRTWDTAVALYVVASRFAREQFVRAGFAPERIVVKPNLVQPDIGEGRGDGGFALYVGRLSPEKGIATLLRAWERLDVPLRIVGDGPMQATVRSWAAGRPHVQYLGRLDNGAVLQMMGDARVLLFLSESYETFGRVVLEALSRGTPVIATAHGAAAELIEDGDTGWFVAPASADAVRATVIWIAEHPEAVGAMRRRARAVFAELYSPERIYHRLIEVFDEARRLAPQPALARSEGERRSRGQSGDILGDRDSQ